MQLHKKSAPDNMVAMGVMGGFLRGVQEGKGPNGRGSRMAVCLGVGSMAINAMAVIPVMCDISLLNQPALK